MPAWVRVVLEAARRVPWKRVMGAVRWLSTSGREYWNRLPPDERRELLDLISKSKGKRSNLSNAEQGRVVDLLQKVRRKTDGPDK